MKIEEKIKKKEVEIEELNEFDKMRELDEITDELENTKNKFKTTKITLIAIIVILLVIIYILCYRVGKIGYNYLSIWNTTGITPIIIRAEDIEVDTKKKMDIFKDARIGDERLIAPMSKGTFKFSVQNDTNEDAVYNMQFVDNMNAFVNMKYRLRIDNIYIKGNEKEYVSIDDLDTVGIILPKDSTSMYTLEWFWESDDEKDIYVGTEKDQYYGLTLHIYASAYKKGSE